MTETKKSLKIYLFLVGVYSVCYAAKDFKKDFSFDFILGLGDILSILIGLATLFIAIKFYNFLEKKDQRLINFFYFLAIYPFLISLYLLRYGFAVFGASLIFILINLAVISYIIKNVKRLFIQSSAEIAVPKPSEITA